MESEHNVMRAIALYSCIAGLILASECSVFFLVKIIAAIFDFYSSRRLERGRNLHQGGER